MLRIRTGARHGLRWGMFGFVAAVFTISSHRTLAAPYADIVVDANSGTVLHSTNPDAQRHPASLTKIMTLYLLFEQIEAGKLKLDSQLKVSGEAAGQMPTKLGLKPGSTMAVEDAIKGIVTRSANDAAVVVAEAIAGDEDEFAKLMTRKAQALGMSHTIYRNASGLPDNDQVTTARDQSIARARHPGALPALLQIFLDPLVHLPRPDDRQSQSSARTVDGVDGIKTGYISASGFNLVTSVHRGNRYLVAVVMGGSSAGSRDARMRDLISEKIAQASTKRTAPMVAEAGVTRVATMEPKVARAEPKPEAKAECEGRAKVAAKIEPKGEAKNEAKCRGQSRAAICRRQRRQHAGALQRAGGAVRNAAARDRRLDRSDPAGSGQDADGQGGPQTASLAPLHVGVAAGSPPARRPQPSPAAAVGPDASPRPIEACASRPWRSQRPNR